MICKFPLIYLGTNTKAVTHANKHVEDESSITTYHQGYAGNNKKIQHMKIDLRNKELNKLFHQKVNEEVIARLKFIVDQHYDKINGTYDYDGIAEAVLKEI